MKKFSNHVINEAYIIGSEPIESALKLKEKIDKLSGLLSQYGGLVADELANEDEDYTADVTDIKNDIRAILNDISMDNLIISIEDCLHKFKKD